MSYTREKNESGLIMLKMQYHAPGMPIPDVHGQILIAPRWPIAYYMVGERSHSFPFNCIEAGGAILMAEDKFWWAELPELEFTVADVPEGDL